MKKKLITTFETDFTLAFASIMNIIILGINYITLNK